MAHPITYEILQHGGPIPADHPAAECLECHGEGRFEVQEPAGCTDLEPRYREELCGCECGRLEEVDCSYCGAWMIADDGVGAIVKGTGDLTGRAFHFVVCGPCAWSEIVEDDEPGTWVQ